MKEYAAYLFDADGTLIDTRELIYQSFLHMTRTMSLPDPDKAVLNAMIGLPMPPQIEYFVGIGKPKEEYAKGLKIYQEYHINAYPRYLGIFPGVKDGLAALQDMGKKMTVVTSRSRRSLLKFMDVLGIADFFPDVVAADDCEKHKPHPEPAIRGLELLDADASASVFIGDAEFDMVCGKEAGMDVAYVAWGGMDYANWPVKPDFTANTFGDLLPDE